MRMAWSQANKHKQNGLGKISLVTVSVGGLLLLVGISLIKIYGISFFGIGEDQKREESIIVNSAWFSISTSEKYGQYLTDKEGYTLYLLDESRCDAECMKEWQVYQDIQPLETIENPAIETDEGIIMPTALSFSPITWKDISLYKYNGDEKAGDTNGIEAMFSSLAKPE